MSHPPPNSVIGNPMEDIYGRAANGFPNYSIIDSKEEGASVS
jgi:hypothetical protein